MISQVHCRRCGQCCRQGGPGLHDQDLPLIADGRIPKEHLLVLRRGEPAADQPAGRHVLLEEEMLKIASKPGQSDCVFFDGAGCAIYAHRPVQCRTLFCRDDAPLKALYRTKRLTRWDVLDKGSALWELAQEHEAHCSYADLTAPALAYRRTQDQRAAQALLQALRYDAAMRRALHPLGAALEFIFGRPLRLTLGALGLAVSEGPAGLELAVRPLPAQLAAALKNL